MQNYIGLLWAFIPLIFIILVVLFKTRSRTSDSKRGFHALMAIGAIIVVGYFVIRTFIIPP